MSENIVCLPSVLTDILAGYRISRLEIISSQHLKDVVILFPGIQRGY